MSRMRNDRADHPARAAAVRPRAARRGVTVIESLVALSVVSILLIASFQLLHASWQSYENLVWQNRLTQETRQALDYFCEVVRWGGYANGDMTAPVARSDSYPQVGPGSNNGLFFFQTPSWSEQWNSFQLENSKTNKSPYFTSYNYFFDTEYAVGQFVTTVHYDYEYRLPLTKGTETQWTYVRTANPTDAERYLINTVYVTVTTQWKPGGSATTYQRQMTSAVHLRSPYNTALPLAQVNGPNSGAP